MKILKKSLHLMISLLLLTKMFHVNKVVHVIPDLLTDKEEDSKITKEKKSFKR